MCRSKNESKGLYNSPAKIVSLGCTRIVAQLYFLFKFPLEYFRRKKGLKEVKKVLNFCFMLIGRTYFQANRKKIFPNHDKRNPFWAGFGNRRAIKRRFIRLICT